MSDVIIFGRCYRNSFGTLVKAENNLNNLFTDVTRCHEHRPVIRSPFIEPFVLTFTVKYFS